METKKTIRLAWSYIKYKKGRTVLTLFILSFSILGFILTNQITQLYKNANIEMTGINQGYHDFALKIPTQENLKALSTDSKVSKIGNEWVIGSGKSEYGPSILIYREDTYNAIDRSLASIIKGQYPIAENEIAISNAFANEYKLDIGDTLNVEYSKYDSESREELYTHNKSFTIVGIVDAPAYAFEVGLVSLSLKDSYRGKVENSLVVLNNPKNAIKQIDDIVFSSGVNPENVSINQPMLAAREDNKYVQLFKYIINIVIYITFGLVIYNLLYFDALSKTKDFGILRCIGHQPFQLVVVIVAQTLIYLLLAYLFAFLIAIAMNRFLAGFIIYLVTNQSAGILSDFNVQIKASIFIQSLLLAIVTVIPSLVRPMASIRKVSPKEAMSYNKDMGSISRVKGRGNEKFIHSKNKLKSYSAKCIQRHPRKIAIATIIVFLSGLLMSGIIAINGTGQVNVDWIKRWIPGDIKVEDIHMQSLTNSEVSEYETFSNNVLEEMSLIEGIAEIESLQVNSNFIKFTIDNINTESDLYHRYESVFTSGVVDGNDTIQLCNLYGVKDIEKYSGKKGIKANGILIDSQLASLLNLEANDKIQIISDVDGSVVELPIVYIFENEFPINHTNEGLSSILMSTQTMKIITGRDTSDRLDIWLDKDVDEKVVKKQLLSIKEISDIGTITTFNDYAADFYKEQRTKQLLLMVVAATFFIIMLVTCFNAIANNFANRARETSILYVVGIDKKSIMKTYIREGLFCILGGVMLLVLSQVALMLFGQNIFEVNSFIFIVYLVLDICILLFCILSTCSCARKLTKNISMSDLQYD